MDSTPQISPVQAEVRRIWDLMGTRDFGQALEAARTLSVEVPENRDVLYSIAVCQRYLLRTADALVTLDRLESLHPGFSRLHQERGYCYVALRDAPKAIQSFLRAVNINTALPDSWKMLAGLYRMQKDMGNERLASGHVSALERLPPEIVSATSFFSDGEFAPAEDLVRAFLARNPDDIEGLRLLGRIAFKRDVLDDAELLFATVLERAPDYRAARHDYALVLLDRHKHERARAELERLLAVDPDNRQYLTLYATACVGLGEHAKAIPLYKRLLVDAPKAADLHLSIAHSLKTLGQTQQAVEAYHAAAAARPHFGDAYWSLANLKTYRFEIDEIEKMRRDEAEPGIPVVDRYHLCFALGKALEDAARYEESFRYYARGNALKRAESRYRPELIELNTRLQQSVCTREFFESRAGSGAKRSSPVFIVGLPRSGSTLLEQILASHSQVEGTQELADIPRIVLELQGHDPDLDRPRYPASLAALTPADLAALGERYLRDTRIYRNAERAGAAHFVDKMPNNFRHLGLIHSILPNAIIIDARREPMACCFSNLKQLFATGQEFTYSIDDIARYYRTYLDLMEHWSRVLPGKVLTVHHEDVVEDLEGSVRRVLDHCGLQFEPACLDFHKNVRSVRTASSEQVRRPIFRDGLDQWKNFEPWLAPLKEALGDALHRYRD